jgi:hypothetical protein
LYEECMARVILIGTAMLLDGYAVSLSLCSESAGTGDPGVPAGVHSFWQLQQRI